VPYKVLLKGEQIEPSQALDASTDSMKVETPTEPRANQVAIAEKINEINQATANATTIVFTDNAEGVIFNPWVKLDGKPDNVTLRKLQRLVAGIVSEAPGIDLVHLSFDLWDLADSS